MQHYYFSRHAKINWLTLDRFSNYSSEDLLNGAFSIHWESEGDHILDFRNQLEQLTDDILEQSFELLTGNGTEKRLTQGCSLMRLPRLQTMGDGLAT